MTECHLHEEGGRAHFMTHRFDRVGARGRLHYQSLCAMEGYDFNEPRTASYEPAFQPMPRLGRGAVNAQGRHIDRTDDRRHGVSCASKRRAAAAPCSVVVAPSSMMSGSLESPHSSMPRRKPSTRKWL